MRKPRDIDTPEHDKLEAVEAEWDAVARFAEWLVTDRGLEIARYESKPATLPTLCWANVSPKTLADEFFGIDRNRINQEEKATLALLKQIADEYVPGGGAK